MKTCKKITVSLAIFFICLTAVHSQDMKKIDRLTKEMTEIIDRAIARGINATPQEEARLKEIEQEITAEYTNDPQVKRLIEKRRKEEQEELQKQQEAQKQYEEQSRQEKQRRQIAFANRAGRASLITQDNNNSGVVINGVRWASRNVGIRATFVARPESLGAFFQWNRKKAWPATDDWVDNWNPANVASNAWEKSNDPCPAGWRIPSVEDINKLLDYNRVNNEMALVNGVEGRIFSDKVTGKTIFLPVQGYRIDNSGQLYGTENCGYYWSRSVDFLKRPYRLSFSAGEAGAGGAIRGFGRENGDASGFCVRCVAE